MTVILCVVGSVESAWTLDGEITARHLIATTFDLLQPDRVISGQSPKGGVDLWTEGMAEAAGIPFTPYPPTPATVGGASHFTWEQSFKPRNAAMAQACTHLLAIRSHRSHTFSSAWTAERARTLGKVVSVVIV